MMKVYSILTLLSLKAMVQAVDINADERIFDPWRKFANYDLGGKGDVQTIKNWAHHMSWEELKQKVVENGWSGVSVRWGHAYFKKVNYQIKPSDLNLAYGCDTWVYDPTREQETFVWNGITPNDYNHENGVVGPVGDY